MNTLTNNKSDDFLICGKYHKQLFLKAISYLKGVKNIILGDLDITWEKIIKKKLAGK